MNELAQRLKLALQRHPKRFMGGLGALLLGTGVTAFGIAPIDDNLDLLPVRDRKSVV